ncbi:MAG: caspase family protein [Leptolyngbya sp. SIO1E4]|nr:caspase family protein [Leptolyngbya sp. SIO1E4]
MAVRKRWAFLVGINRYVDYGSLNYCVDDVLALEGLLKAANYTVWSLHDRLDEKDNDGNPNRLFPTEKNIRGRLADFCDLIQGGDKQGCDDLLLVYFACHGSRKFDGTPRLIARDTQQSLENEAIAVTEIEQRMKDSGAGCRMLMLDACQIGLGTRDLEARGTADPDLLRKIHEMARGYALLAASSDHQDAKEWGGMKHGVFSYYVLSGLSGEAGSQDRNYVTVTDLAGYVGLHMQQWAAEHQVRQVPRQRVEDNLGGFILIPEVDQPNLRAFKPPAPLSWSESSAQPVQNRGKTPAEIIECLWSLDYEPQCHSFKTNTRRSRRAAAFVVQAQDSRIQHWLVKRLVNQIPNVANAKVFPFLVPTHPMWKQRDFNELWLDLARKLQCPDDSTSVIDALVAVYQTKPIIIAMYGWSGIRRSQRLQQQVLSELWEPLVEAVGELSVQPLRSRIILFLAEQKDTVADRQATASQSTPSTVSAPIRLDPLTAITPEHLAEWMESDGVYPMLSQFVPEAYLGDLIDEEILEWSTDPVKAIEEICYLFKLENGIADLEVEWRLAG